MRPVPTWAASPSGPGASGRPGEGAACARPGSCTDGRQQSAIAHMAAAAPTTVAKQFASATTLHTTTQRWQQSGTERPLGTGHWRL